MMGMETSKDAFMTAQERVDFGIIILVFGTLFAGLGSCFSYRFQMLTVCFPSQSKYFHNPDRSDHGEFFPPGVYPFSRRLL
jgi:hypothetical protein